jgi:hypothetical protein
MVDTDDDDVVVDDEVVTVGPGFEVDVEVTVVGLVEVVFVTVAVVDVTVAVAVRHSHTACADFEADRKEDIPSVPLIVEQAALAHANALKTMMFD